MKRSSPQGSDPKNKNILTKKSALVFCLSVPSLGSENLRKSQKEKIIKKLVYVEKRCSRRLSSHKFQGHSRRNNELRQYPKFGRNWLSCLKVSRTFSGRSGFSPHFLNMRGLLQFTFSPFPNYSTSLFNMLKPAVNRQPGYRRDNS